MKYAWIENNATTTRSAGCAGCWEFHARGIANGEYASPVPGRGPTKRWTRRWRRSIGKAGPAMGGPVSPSSCISRGTVWAPSGCAGASNAKGCGRRNARATW